MGLIPSFNEMKRSVEESIELLRRAVSALEKLAAEQERANDLFAEVNEARTAATSKRDLATAMSKSEWAVTQLRAPLPITNRMHSGTNNPLDAPLLTCAESHGGVDVLDDGGRSTVPGLAILAVKSVAALNTGQSGLVCALTRECPTRVQSVTVRMRLNNSSLHGPAIVHMRSA